MSYEYIGYTAVGLGAISAIPQIYQIIKTKKVRDINFYFCYSDYLLDYYISCMEV